MRPSKSTAQFAAVTKSDVVVVVPNMRRLAREFREYPNRRDDYQLTEVIGRGVTATVRNSPLCRFAVRRLRV